MLVYVFVCFHIDLYFWVFYSGIHPLPDPVLNNDGHYLSFDEVYGTDTPNEKDLPSSNSAMKPSKRKKVVSFNVTQQHVKNVGGLLVKCEECQMWRHLFSKRKLSPQSVVKLKKILEDMSYTCVYSLSSMFWTCGKAILQFRISRVYLHILLQNPFWWF